MLPMIALRIAHTPSLTITDLLIDVSILNLLFRESNITFTTLIRPRCYYRHVFARRHENRDTKV